jgi:hypothetical protein
MQLHCVFHILSTYPPEFADALDRKAGAKCNGPPGLRPQYFATYYGAFFLDAEGRNIEAHTISPAFISEPFQRNVLLAAVSAMLAAGYWAYSGGLF